MPHHAPACAPQTRGGGGGAAAEGERELCRGGDTPRGMWRRGSAGERAGCEFGKAGWSMYRDQGRAASLKEYEWRLGETRGGGWGEGEGQRGSWRKLVV